MLSRFILYIAYSIKTSSRYQKTKRFVYDLLINPQSGMRSYFDIFMMTLVISSVSLLLYEVQHPTSQASIFFERIVVTVFISEYLLRGWLYSDIHQMLIKAHQKSEYLGIPFKLHKVLLTIISNKLKYVFSLSAIIDLLAILPSYRPLRILRIFLIFRLFKLFRYSQSIKMFTDVLSSKRFELTTLAIFLGFLTFIASTAIYMFENENNGGQINDLYDAAYWAIVTLSTVGYGDLAPVTPGGRFITMVLILTGLGVLAFFTSIIVSAFSEKMHDFQEERLKSTIEKYSQLVIICGFGRVGQEISRLLAQKKQDFIVIEQDENLIALAKEKGYLALQGDASRNAILKQAGIHHNAQSIICTTGDDIINVYITLTSHYLNPKVNIIARVNRAENIKKLYQAGAHHIVEPFAIVGLLAAEYIGQPVAFEAIHGIIDNEKDVDITAISICSGCFLEGMTLQELNIEQYKLRLIGIVSDNPVHIKRKNRYKLHNQHFYFNPEPNFTLYCGEILILLGRDMSISHLQDLIETSRLKRTHLDE